MPEFNFINALVFFVTFSSALVLFYDFRQVMTARVLRWMGKVSLIVVWLEALYGIVQGGVGAARSGRFDGGMGDIVRGTVEPGFTTTSSGSNPIFVILISTLLIFALATIRVRPSVPVWGSILLSWLLASVMHTLFFFAGALTISLFLFSLVKSSLLDPISRWQRRNHRRLFGWVLMVLLFFAITVPIMLPNNLANVPTHARMLTDLSHNSSSPKMRITYNVLFTIPAERPLQPFIGVGPGQFVSRAALILTGRYLRFPIPFDSYTSALTEKYVVPLMALRTHLGSTHFPHYSWLAIYAELGAIGLVTVVFLMLRAGRLFLRSASVEFPFFSMLLLSLLLYIAFLGIHDNYWEYTQAIFPAVLILRFGYVYLQQGSRYMLANHTALAGAQQSIP